MKRFLYNILIFLIPFLLVSAVLEYAIRSADSFYKKKIDGLVRESDSIQLLVLGNSQSAHDIDPGAFDIYTYNMAFDAQPFYIDKRIALQKIDVLDKLQYVLISIEFHSLYFSNSPSRDLYYHYYYNLDEGGQSFYLEDISYFYFGYNPRLSMELMFNELDDLNHGWANNEETNYSSFDSAAVQERIAHFNDIVYSNLDNKKIILQDVDDFINTLIEMNIRPVIITTPLHTSYRSKLDKTILKQNEKDINNLCAKYGIEYWSYFDEPFEDSEFRDNSHLNSLGARRLSKMINEKILQLEKRDH